MALRRGMVVVLVAVLLPVIVGVMALALDGGLLYLQRRQAQSVADAAALAGAYQLYHGSNFSVAQTAAIAIGTQNGITIPSSQVTAPQTGYVSVSVTSSKPRCFSGLWGAGTLSVTASAVARGINPGNGAAIIVLAPTGSNAFTVTAAGGVYTNGGTIAVNSSDSKAATITAGGDVHASEVDITGGYYYSSSGRFVTDPVSNNIKTGVSTTPDPLASLQPPDPTTLPQRSYTNGQMTLLPGYYPSGINFSMPSGTITLQPGIYYINGGFGDSSGANIVGNGVMIYNASQSFSVTGSGNVTLSPMTSGPYAGITIFHNPNSNSDVSITGNGSLNITGTIYCADSKLTVTGNGSTIGSRSISKTLSVTGNGSLYMSSANRGTSLFGLVQ
jgi:Flp pilus assembly protein TadG